MRRWLVLLVFLSLIVLGFYFGVVRVPEAGGAVISVGFWLPTRPLARVQPHLPTLGPRRSWLSSWPC
jgi:hypothetical protein